MEIPRPSWGIFYLNTPLPMQKHEFILGGKLLADLHRPQKADSPLIIYAHGINGYKDWGGMDRIAQRFAQAGLAFLKFNYRHNGTTLEHPTEFYDLEAYAADRYLKRQSDLRLVCDYAQKELGFRQIFLLGHSRGGVDVLLYAAQQPIKLQGLLTWAAPSHAQTPWQLFSESEMQAWRESGRHYRRNGRTGQELPIDYGLYEEYQQHRDFLDPEKAARNLKLPWLIVHGEDDEAVFVKDAYDYKSWQPEAEVLVIPETGHTFDRSEPWLAAELPPATLAALERSIEFIKEAAAAS